MWNRVPARNRARAIWAINQEIEPQLENMSVAIGTAGQLSSLAREFTERRTLYGRPVVAMEQCKKLGDKGDIVLIDPKQYLGIDKMAYKPLNPFMLDSCMMRVFSGLYIVLTVLHTATARLHLQTVIPVTHFQVL
jgi:hypothetical protein